MSEPALTFGVSIASPTDQVFLALTEGRHLARWFCHACESEPRVNGRLVMRWTGEGSSREPFEARWVQFESPLRAAFQGGHTGYPGGNAGTVWFVLEPADDGSTMLQVSHELPAGTDYDAHVAAWRKAWPRALDRLSAFLAPMPSTPPGESH